MNKDRVRPVDRGNRKRSEKSRFNTNLIPEFEKVFVNIVPYFVYLGSRQRKFIGESLLATHQHLEWCITIRQCNAGPACFRRAHDSFKSIYRVFHTFKARNRW